jgi:hypothetical protein
MYLLFILLEYSEKYFKDLKIIETRGEVAKWLMCLPLNPGVMG